MDGWMGGVRRVIGKTGVTGEGRTRKESGLETYINSLYAYTNKAKEYMCKDKNA